MASIAGFSEYFIPNALNIILKEEDMPMVY